MMRSPLKADSFHTRPTSPHDWGSRTFATSQEETAAFENSRTQTFNRAWKNLSPYRQRMVESMIVFGEAAANAHSCVQVCFSAEDDGSHARHHVPFVLRDRRKHVT